MKRHYLGPSHGFPLEALRHTEVIEERNIALLSVDALIVDNELLMRSQHWVLLPHNRLNDFVTGRVFHICHHAGRRSGTAGRKEAGGYVHDLVKSQLDMLEGDGECCAETRQCVKCPLDFVLDAVDLGDKGVTVVLTKWISLGAGLRPSDPKWQSHLFSSSARTGIVKGYEPHVLGSIRERFEGNLGIYVIREGKMPEVGVVATWVGAFVAPACLELLKILLIYKEWYPVGPPSSPPTRTLHEERVEELLEAIHNSLKTIGEEFEEPTGLNGKLEVISRSVGRLEELGESTEKLSVRGPENWKRGIAEGSTQLRISFLNRLEFSSSRSTRALSKPTRYLKTTSLSSSGALPKAEIMSSWTHKHLFHNYKVGMRMLFVKNPKPFIEQEKSPSRQNGSTFEDSSR
ncbi:hypothetical protein G7Y89_g14547 [Cudoniella acicularis]|uniref:Uncharacterized protein n=1 Tax=Cudoniella acicularis TaxID=354080 RepID=A0A8H4VV66_9HELO|nr:hypothetical protein G7Y89_g14547 [Cudoniella acicularis]